MHSLPGHRLMASAFYKRPFQYRIQKPVSADALSGSLGLYPPKFCMVTVELKNDPSQDSLIGADELPDNVRWSSRALPTYKLSSAAVCSSTSIWRPASANCFLCASNQAALKSAGGIRGWRCSKASQRCKAVSRSPLSWYTMAISSCRSNDSGFCSRHFCNNTTDRS